MKRVKPRHRLTLWMSFGVAGTALLLAGSAPTAWADEAGSDNLYAGEHNNNPVPSPAATLTIIHVNDTHSHLVAVGPKDQALDGTLGGLAKAATVIGTLEATEPNPILVHAGDLFQGDIYFNVTFGVAEWRILSSLGLAAAAVGNHEFHLGPEALAGALAQAFAGGDSPLLSANLDLSGFPALVPFIAQNAIKEVGGIRVGFFGLTTPLDLAALPAPVRILGTDVTELLGIAAEQAQRLRAQRVDAVICISHLGLQLDQVLAANVPGIDAIVGGHDHSVLSQPVFIPGPGGKQVPIVQAGAFYQHVGKLTLSVESGVATFASYVLVPVDAGVPRMPEVQAAVRQIQDQVVARYGDLFHHPIARALFDVTNKVDPDSRVRDSGLGNLLTDALRWRTGTNLGLNVNGFIAEDLTRGWVVGDDVFRTVGFGFDPETSLGFRLFTLEITGAELIKALETTLEAALSGSDDLFIQVSGMRYAYQSRRPAGQRVRSVFVGGRPLDPARTYTATVNNGVVVGLPQLGVQVSHVTDIGDNEYLAVHDYVAALRLIDYTPQGRIRDLSLHR